MSQVTRRIPKHVPTGELVHAMARRIVFGLGLIAVLLATGLAGLWALSAEHEISAALINTSGRSRMLAQRAWALEEELIALSGDGDTGHLRALLLSTADQMEAIRAEIAHTITRPALLHTSPEIQRLFFSGPDALDARLQLFIAGIRAFAVQPDGLLEQENVFHLQLLREIDGDNLLISLDSFVMALQRQNERNMAAIRKFSGALFAVIMAALALEMMWLFRPVYKVMEDETERLNQAVEERTAQLAQAYKEAKAETAARKIAEESLRRNQAKLRMVLSDLPVIVTAADEYGVFTMAEGKGLEAAGLHPSQMVGRSLEEVYENNEAVIDAYRGAMRGHRRETVSQTRGRYFHYITSPRHGDDGSAAGAIAVAMDVTERIRAENLAKLAQKRLLHADKMRSLGVLVAGVAHEINNPNGYIMMNVSILERICGSAMNKLMDTLDPDEQLIPGEMTLEAAARTLPALFGGLADGSARIRDIVSRLKNFARQDFEAPKTAVDVNKAVESSIRLTRNIIKSSTNKFSMSMAPSTLLVWANGVEIEQVLVNLITNACQALTGPDQKIAVSTELDAQANMAVITVQDEGRGIPKEAQEMITEPFFTTRRESGGLGLGLSISHNIISGCGGVMEFTSEKGAGTRVTVRIPAIGSPPAKSQDGRREEEDG